MQWTDAGFVVALRRHGESSLIVELLTREHGRHLGLVRGGQSPRQRAVLQPGNEVAAVWRGRLSEHLGAVTCELVRVHAARFIDDADRLAGLASAAALVAATLPEREPHADVFASFAALLDALDSGSGWPAQYVGWECSLLAALGFGLDLTRCAVTGATADLTYVSPRSGRAVSCEAGRPYDGRLLLLPEFLWRDAPADAAQIGAGLRLTEHFLLHHVLLPHGHILPAARSRLAARLRRAPGADTLESHSQSVIPAQAGIKGNGSGGSPGPPPSRGRRS
jgi:DNA repair protein RecO (recombination protein O)